MHRRHDLPGTRAVTQRQAGVELQLEIGPGKVLSGLAAKIDRGLARANVERTGDVEKAFAAVAEAVR